MIGNVVYVSVGLLFWVTIGVYIVMETGKMGARHSPLTPRNTLQKQGPTLQILLQRKDRSVGAAPELVSEAGEPILGLFGEHAASP